METHDHSNHHDKTTSKDWLLFAGVSALIFLATTTLEYLQGNSGSTSYMRQFMSVFFFVFGIFKLLDLPGFVMSYIGYDIIARRWKAYAYAYPFIELAFAAGYFLNWFPVNYFTLIIMIIGSIGVTQQLLRGSKIRCACLGTYIKLPLTTVSLIEDVAMGVMAAMLILTR